MLISSIRQLAASPPPSRQGGQAQGSDDDFEEDGMMEDGEGEIASLARRILDLTVEGGGGEGEGSRFSNNGASGGGDVGSQGSDHAALRDSVRRALSGSR
jgi:vacuolar protein 8